MFLRQRAVVQLPEYIGPKELRQIAYQYFGSLLAMSAAMGLHPKSLSGFLQGKDKVGPVTRGRIEQAIMDRGEVK
jgi:DNA-binding transcriptional regulator YdaS (Cro superfamily)